MPSAVLRAPGPAGLCPSRTLPGLPDRSAGHGAAPGSSLPTGKWPLGEGLQEDRTAGAEAMLVVWGVAGEALTFKGGRQEALLPKGSEADQSGSRKGF